MRAASHQFAAIDQCSLGPFFVQYLFVGVSLLCRERSFLVFPSLFPAHCTPTPASSSFSSLFAARREVVDSDPTLLFHIFARATDEQPSLTLHIPFSCRHDPAPLSAESPSPFPFPMYFYGPFPFTSLPRRRVLFRFSEFSSWKNLSDDNNRSPVSISFLLHVDRFRRVPFFGPRAALFFIATSFPPCWRAEAFSTPTCCLYVLHFWADTRWMGRNGR